MSGETGQQLQRRAFWNPFQTIETVDQARSMVQSGSILPILLIIDGIRTIIMVSNMPTVGPDSLEIQIGYAIGAIFAIGGAVLWYLLHKFQWWAIVGLLSAWGLLALWSRAAGLLAGDIGLSFLTVLISALIVIALIRMVRGKLALGQFLSGKRSRVDPTVFE